MDTLNQTFHEKLRNAAASSGSIVCVGLDPVFDSLPETLQSLEPGQALAEFCIAIVDATSDLVMAYKPNLGFFMAHGLAGLEALLLTRQAIPEEIPVILDCKVGDMKHTDAGYARGYMWEWGFDAVTTHPYLGRESVEPFLQHPSKGAFVLSKTSNPGSGEFQDLHVQTMSGNHPLHTEVAYRVKAWDSDFAGTAGLVVGATYPDQLAQIREIVPSMPILLPGVGAQSGDLASSVAAGAGDAPGDLIVAASRSIIYAGSGNDFADGARQAVIELNSEIAASRSVV